MIICNKKIIIEAIKTNNLVNLYLFDKSFIHEFAGVDSKKISIVDKNELYKISNDKSKKYCAKINPLILQNIDNLYKTLDNGLKNTKKNLVILDHIQDSQNFGAIIRNCVANNIFTIVIPKNRQVKINEFVINASVGAIFHINIYIVNSLQVFIYNIKHKYKYWIYGTSVSSKTKSMFVINFNNPYCIVFGNEHLGMSKTLQNLCDENFNIPINKIINSLNISSSIAITLFYLQNTELFSNKK